jgi:hypothetical protein
MSKWIEQSVLKVVQMADIYMKCSIALATSEI